MLDGVKRLASDERGSAAIEYALVTSLVSVTVIVALTATGIVLRDRVEAVVQAIAEAGRR